MMKFRRFTPAGIAAARDYLAKAKAAAALDLPARDALIASPALTESIPALADLDFDPTRTFDTTFAFCEYLDPLIRDRKPLSYCDDVGLWSWLAMVYLPQLIKKSNGSIKIGDETRYVPNPSGYQDYYRHLLAGAFRIYATYDLAGDASICKALLWKTMDTYGDVYEQIASRQNMVQNPSIVAALNRLYFDEAKQKLKPRSGGDYPGSARRFVVAVDQLAMTRDFFECKDVEEILNILPYEFDAFNPKKDEDR